MNISLTKELERYLQRKVSSGLYTSVSEVVREGLRLLQEQDRVKATPFAEHRGETWAGPAGLIRGGIEREPNVIPAPKTRSRTPTKAKKR